MFISIIIPTHNKSQVLRQTLERLHKQTLPPDRHEIIVVENNCTDDTEEMVKAMQGGPVDIRCASEARVGPAKARNTGINLACGDVILFLDDDILVEPDHLERHLAYHDGTPLALMGRIRDVSKYRPGILEKYMLEKQHAGVWANLDPTIDLENVPGLYVTTGNLSVSRNALDLVALPGVSKSRVDYFDESLFSWEDIDFGVRLQRAGGRIKIAQEIWCQHNHPRDWRGVQERSFRWGYWARMMMQKYPKLARPPKSLYPLPVAYSLFALVVFGLPLTLVLYPVWRWPLFKSIGMWSVFEANRGYWRAEREISSQ